MEFSELLNALQIIDLSAQTRSAAIRQIIDAVGWQQLGVDPAVVFEAIEQREAAAQTVVAEGMALPHARVDWDGDFVAVLGRNSAGIDYGIPDHPVHIVVLLVFGTRHAGLGGEKRALQILGKIAMLFQDAERRRALIFAPDRDSVRILLRDAAGLEPITPRRLLEAVPCLSNVLVQHAVRITETLRAQALLLAVERPASVPWQALREFHGRLLVVTSAESADLEVRRPDTHVFDIPHAELARLDRANLGLLLAASKGLVTQHADVVCVTGPRDKLDSISVTTPVVHFQNIFRGGPSKQPGRVAPAIFLRVLSLAIELGTEGREGKPVGAIFVIGDIRRVLRFTQQLVLNPFHGYSHQLRNILDPSLTETVKEFALLDGAFIVHGNGTLHSAGTYLVPQARVRELTQGLGARHQSAAAITAHTSAIAIVVSQSTGAVTVFQAGKTVLTLEQAAITRW